jgi:hypothetical protein
MRKVSLAVVMLVALSLAAATGLADSMTPELDVYTVDQSRGAATDLSLDVLLLAGSPAASTVAITSPAGYGAILTQQIGTRLGEADLDLAMPGSSAAPVRATGSTVVADPAAFAANAAAQQCAPGAHTAVWSMSLSNGMAVPVAVDAVTSDGTIRITVCLSAVPSPGLVPVQIYIDLANVFRNPNAAKTYWWRALVTPTGPTGANPAAAYELQGGEPIPEPLSLTATWDKKKHLFTARGVLTGGGAPRAGIHVHMYAGATSKRDAMREIGVATTTRTGAYVFRQKRATKPSYVYGEVRFYIYGDCALPSTAPAGCASATIDGTDSFTIKTK